MPLEQEKHLSATHRDQGHIFKLQKGLPESTWEKEEKAIQRAHWSLQVRWFDECQNLWGLYFDGIRWSNARNSERLLRLGPWCQAALALKNDCHARNIARVTPGVNDHALYVSLCLFFIKDNTRNDLRIRAKIGIGDEVQLLCAECQCHLVIDIGSLQHCRLQRAFLYMILSSAKPKSTSQKSVLRFWMETCRMRWWCLFTHARTMWV